MEIYVKMSFIFIFSFFLVFNHDFVIYIDFTHILLLILYSKLMRNVAALAIFYTI